MTEPRFKKCPHCGFKTAMALYYDEFPCTHCDGKVKVEYCNCPECNYSYRLCNGEFLDGSKISEEDLDKIVGELEEALLEGHVVWDNEQSSISDHLINCIRCGSPRTYRSSSTSYCCSDCDFSWEMLEYE